MVNMTASVGLKPVMKVTAPAMWGERERERERERSNLQMPPHEQSKEELI
jgi:hypothetical protein